MPTTNTERAIVAVAQQTVQQIYRKGVKFSKAGVILLDIRPEAVIQGALPFDEDDTVPNAQAASVALDAITARFGKSALVCGAALKGSGLCLGLRLGNTCRLNAPYDRAFFSNTEKTMLQHRHAAWTCIPLRFLFSGFAHTETKT